MRYSNVLYEPAFTTERIRMQIRRSLTNTFRGTAHANPSQSHKHLTRYSDVLHDRAVPTERIRMQIRRSLTNTRSRLQTMQTNAMQLPEDVRLTGCVQREINLQLQEINRLLDGTDTDCSELTFAMHWHGVQLLDKDLQRYRDLQTSVDLEALRYECARLIEHLNELQRLMVDLVAVARGIANLGPQ